MCALLHREGRKGRINCSALSYLRLQTRFSGGLLREGSRESDLGSGTWSYTRAVRLPSCYILGTGI